MFKCIYSQEMEEYFNMRSKELSKSTVAHELLYLRRFDSYLVSKVDSRGQLDESCINGWVSTLRGKSGTIENEIITIRQFLKYIGLTGERVFLPIVPKIRDDYQAYIFSDEEIEMIFHSADNIRLTKRYKERNLAIEFPVILRLLYCCGLRITETIKIDIQDVNFKEGVIHLKRTKWRKERYVPMAPVMTTILEQYCIVMGILGKHNGWLFPSSYSEDHISYSTVSNMFDKILSKNNIELPNRKKYERGPCLHCLRHVFVFKSFYQGEQNGFSIDQTVPYLSIFLGHDSLSETEKYMKFSNEMFPETIEAFGSFMDGLLPEVNYES